MDDRFDMKNWTKSVAVEDMMVVGLGSRRGRSFDHCALALPPHDSMAADQKLTNLSGTVHAGCQTVCVRQIWTQRKADVDTPSRVSS